MTYDDRGRLQRMDRQDSRSSVPTNLNWVARYFYGAATDEYTRMEIDGGLDGRLDQITERTYDAAGRLFEERTKYETDIRTMEDAAFMRYTYDDQGRISLREHFPRSGMTVSYFLEHSYAPTEAGHIEEQRMYWGSPSRLQSLWTLTFEDGRLLLESQDSDQDGIADAEDRYAYEPGGNLSEIQHVYSGRVGLVDTFQYDELGRRISKQRSNTEDVTSETRWFYDCPGS